MKIARIVSDGTPVGTHVFLENGEELQSIFKVNWEIEAGGIAKIEVHAHDVQVDLVGELKDDPA